MIVITIDELKKLSLKCQRHQHHIITVNLDYGINFVMSPPFQIKPTHQ